MPRTNFRPQIDGFAFENNWVFDDTERAEMVGILRAAIEVALVILTGPFGAVLGVLGVGAGLARWLGGMPDHYGLCGGMAFASLDYHRAGLVLPRGLNVNDQPARPDAGGSPEGAALRAYIWRRQLESLRADAPTFLAWMAVLHLIPREFPFFGGHPWLRDRSREQWDTLKQHLDAGEPWPIGLLGNTTDPFHNHQVLAYGYEDPGDGTGLIYVYDMNCPGSEQTLGLHFNATGSDGWPILVSNESCSNADRGPLRAFFCERYSPSAPPVALTGDLGVIYFSPDSSPGPHAGAIHEIDVTARNNGFSMTPPFRLAVTAHSRATGNDLQVGSEPSPSAIPTGGSRSSRIQIRFDDPGIYDCFASADFGNVGGVHALRVLPPSNPSAGALVMTMLPQRQPRIAVSARDHNFGAVAAGSVAEFTFQVTNTGELPLIIFSVSTPSDAAFSRQLSYWQPAEPTLPLTIGDVRQILRITVKFAPSDTAEHTSEIRVTSNAYGSPTLTLRLHGGIYVPPARCAEIDARLAALQEGLADPDVSAAQKAAIRREMVTLRNERRLLRCP